MSSGNKSKLVQLWLTKFTLAFILRTINFKIRKRVNEKREAYARVGSIFVIERVMSRFLKNFRKQRQRRTYNKIKFCSISFVSIAKETLDLRARKLVLKFLVDLKDMRRLYTAFSSVNEKVKVIQKRWKSKAEVNKARIMLLRAYWNNEVHKIHHELELKELKTRNDKNIMIQLKKIDSELRNLILKDFYFS